jgi:hypothetical protein
MAMAPSIAPNPIVTSDRIAKSFRKDRETKMVPFDDDSMTRDKRVI